MPAESSASSSAPVHQPAPSRWVQPREWTGDDLRKLAETRDIFVTCAVQNSPVNERAMEALIRAADECSGTVVVIPIRFKNPTRRNEIDRDEGWDRQLDGFLLDTEIRPHSKLAIMPRKAAATVNNPLPGKLDGRTQDRSAVFGHPQVAMRTVATPQLKLPKIYYSSGAVTQKEGFYSDTDAGDMASFHHTIAAVKVEVRGDRFHLRETTWDGAKFIDLNRAYTPHGVIDAAPPEVLIMGDWHEDVTDPSVIEATFGEGGIVPILQPLRLGVHDVADNALVSPHERGRAMSAAVNAHSLVEGHIQRVGERLVWFAGFPSFQRPDGVVVIRSNHDEWLDRWLDGSSCEPKDLEFFSLLRGQVLRGRRLSGEWPIALEVAIRERMTLPGNVRFLKSAGPDSQWRIAGVECGMHGHRGPNGARGSAQNLARIGTRSMVGHMHSPWIWQGVYVVGTSSLYQLGYNDGPSSWLHTHGLVHTNGFRQMIHLINSKWRGQ